MRLFFRSYVPFINGKRDCNTYCFSRKEMLFICRDSLSMLFREFDAYFEELTLNLCKMIYNICNINWRTQDSRISIDQIEHSFLSANEADAQMVNLLFGTVGLL